MWLSQVAALWLLLLPLSAPAHHSVSAFFDRDEITEVEGIVTAFFWRNPHVEVNLLVENADGETEEWRLEGGALNTLTRRGFRQDMVTIGDRVRGAGNPSRRNQHEIFVTNFLLSSGEEIIFTDVNAPLRWTDPSQSLSVASTAGETTPISETPPTGIFRVWSWGGTIHRLRRPISATPAAQEASAGWDPLTDDPALRCAAPGMPNANLNPYPIEFIDEGDRIRLRIEEWDATRVIHMNTDADSGAQAPSLLGYSVGHWEGKTLLIETIQVDAPYLDDSGTPQSENAEIFERYTLSEDEDRLDYEVIVIDPQYLLEPAIWDASWIWQPGAEIIPFECTLRSSSVGD
jgi:hypothetical protein